jgi:hypothetical protein
LRANKLTTLPDSLAQLTHLEKLDLRWNKLSHEPAWLPQLSQHGCTVFV